MRAVCVTGVSVPLTCALQLTVAVSPSTLTLETLAVFVMSSIVFLAVGSLSICVVERVHQARRSRRAHRSGRAGRRSPCSLSVVSGARCSHASSQSRATSALRVVRRTSRGPAPRRRPASACCGAAVARPGRLRRRAWASPSGSDGSSSPPQAASARQRSRPTAAASYKPVYGCPHYPLATRRVPSGHDHSLTRLHRLVVPVRQSLSKERLICNASPRPSSRRRSVRCCRPSARRGRP